MPSGTYKAQYAASTAQVTYIAGSATRIHCSAGTKNISPPAQAQKKTRLPEAPPRTRHSSGTRATHASQPQASGKYETYSKPPVSSAGTRRGQGSVSGRVGPAC